MFAAESMEYIGHVLMTAASKIGRGACLMQDQGRGWQPIAYASNVNSEAEAKYSITELECLAVVWAVMLFRPYVYGRRFKIVTDHAALKWLMTRPELAGRLHRWSLTLQEYEFETVYRAGATNAVADALSRTPVPVLIATGRRPRRHDEQEDGRELLVDETPVASTRLWTRAARRRAEAAAEAEARTAAIPSEQPASADSTGLATVITETRNDAGYGGEIVTPLTKVRQQRPEPSEGTTTAQPQRTKRAADKAIPGKPAAADDCRSVNRPVRQERVVDDEIGADPTLQLTDDEIIAAQRRAKISGRRIVWPRSWRVNDKMTSVWVQCAVYAYNSAQHSTVGLTPNELMMGRRLRPPNELLRRTAVTEAGELVQTHARLVAPLEKAHEYAERARQKEKQRQAKYYDRNARQQRTFQVGDRVWVYNPPREPKPTKFVHQAAEDIDAQLVEEENTQTDDVRRQRRLYEQRRALVTRRWADDYRNEVAKQQVIRPAVQTEVLDWWGCGGDEDATEPGNMCSSMNSNQLMMDDGALQRRQECSLPKMGDDRDDGSVSKRTTSTTTTGESWKTL
ncbi:unnamed protein product [Phytophthora fragariaefolia]|uniref:Unnamed protein product n=1 Tax=Phytophthora fragariaefolia TaxID=1490495 RepID=A0A9W6YBA1_9STRA|nr:unnamed protein product [Phytophthora fragariaefolia]